MYICVYIYTHLYVYICTCLHVEGHPTTPALHDICMLYCQPQPYVASVQISYMWKCTSAKHTSVCMNESTYVPAYILACMHTLPDMHTCILTYTHPSIQPASRPVSQPASQPASHPAIQPAMHPFIPPSIHPPIHPSIHAELWIHVKMRMHV